MSEQIKPDNLRIWEALGKTDPKHTKPFKRAGGFSGTAIKPMWSFKRMTEHFGPCGIGWGPERPTFETREAGDELLVFCTVGLWYLEKSGEKGNVFGVGGDKYLIKQKDGLRTSDEAFKAAYTDALGNAMKLIGVAADVHMGLFDDNKYVRETQAEFEREAVEDEVQLQKLAHAEPPPIEFLYSNKILICRPLDIQARQDKKGKPFYAVKLNGKIGQNGMAFCWHATMFPALDKAKGKICKFAAESVGDFCNINEVLEVDGAKVEAASPFELKARTGASIIELTEAELQELLTMNKGSWEATYRAISTQIDVRESGPPNQYGVVAIDADIPF